MSALDRIADQFDSAVMSRGDAYFRADRVRMIAVKEDHVTARVQGSESYKVRIEYDEDDDSFYFDCSCPYDFGDGCKHVWATLLAADQRDWAPLSDNRGSHTPPNPSSPLRINKPQSLPPGSTQKRSTAAAQPWKRALEAVASQMSAAAHELDAPMSASWPVGREICYVIDKPSPYYSRSILAIEVMTREPLKSGKMSKWKRARLGAAEWSQAPQEDRLIGQMLAGSGSDYIQPNTGGSYSIGESGSLWLLENICRTGRCRLRAPDGQQPGEMLAWDDGPPWEFRLEGRRSASREFEFVGPLRRPDEQMNLAEPLLLLRCGILVAGQHVAQLEHRGAFQLLAHLREKGSIRLPARAMPDFLKQLCRFPRLPEVDWPDDFRVEHVDVAPRPTLKLRAAKGDLRHLQAELGFRYGDTEVRQLDRAAAILEEAARRVTRRDLLAESAAEERLRKLGFRSVWGWADNGGGENQLQLDRDRLPHAVMQLTAEGWQVEAEGKLFRTNGVFKIEVTSGIDWFDLNGRAEFDGTGVALPKLLAALRKGERTVILDDGTLGVLPEEWLRKYAPIAQMGETDGDAIRFASAQAGLLDALLAAMPEARCDEAFARVRAEINGFAGVAPCNPPDGFVGTLRDYQKDGLGWLSFLQKMGLGGCLADDMGLGKTVQVLAMLLQRVRDDSGPSLAVVPRSLIFNWTQEAARFTPGLRVLDLSSLGQLRGAGDFAQYDLVLTTYGCLRRNIAHFKETQFDYVILDESQAIKNASTQSAKAVRLLRARHRLALSGTPIENHLGELWSLFEFLNPGMLGAATVFKELIRSDGQIEQSGKTLLARALRPFILRRTKSQVARELPDKVEQTLVCQLEGEQRKLYDELKDHYRQSLLGLVEQKGIANVKMHVLEALLRLRQAACHPGLIDPTRKHDGSAKLTALMSNIAEVAAEGHKTLVFSQFTSLLAIVRAALEEQKITYEYLDGKTRDRQSKVERFQTDAACPVFLISLKAGGVGLNLTAAEYVFLLDPWWNPAIEAQAIDRAHRIGQTRTVFSYRLIAKETVEEKILELQKSKRELADAIINEDNSIIARMGVEELRTLLS